MTTSGRAVHQDFLRYSDESPHSLVKRSKSLISGIKGAAVLEFSQRGSLLSMLISTTCGVISSLNCKAPR